MKGHIALSTRVPCGRVNLRPPRHTDIPMLGRVLRRNAEHLRRWSPLAPPGVTPSSLTELSRGVLRHRSEWKLDRAYLFLIVDAEDDTQIVGRLGITEVARGALQCANLGYWIAADRQGQGLGLEAVRAACRFAFGPLGLHRLQAAVSPDNERSARLLRKLGFRKEGVAERYLHIAGKWQDHRIFALTAEEAAVVDTGPVEPPLEDG